MMYKEHPIAKKLKDRSISGYNPKWGKNSPKKYTVENKTIEDKTKKKEKLGFHNF